jgi:microcystin degradation protein MlrC
MKTIEPFGKIHRDDFWETSYFDFAKAEEQINKIKNDIKDDLGVSDVNDIKVFRLNDTILQPFETYILQQRKIKEEAAERAAEEAQKKAIEAEIKLKKAEITEEARKESIIKAEEERKKAIILAEKVDVATARKEFKKATALLALKSAEKAVAKQNWKKLL